MDMEVDLSDVARVRDAALGNAGKVNDEGANEGKREEGRRGEGEDHDYDLWDASASCGASTPSILCDQT